jgi:hypothetical protein
VDVKTVSKPVWLGEFRSNILKAQPGGYAMEAKSTTWTQEQLVIPRSLAIKAVVAAIIVALASFALGASLSNSITANSGQTPNSNQQEPVHGRFGHFIH